MLSHGADARSCRNPGPSSPLHTCALATPVRAAIKTAAFLGGLGGETDRAFPISKTPGPARIGAVAREGSGRRRAARPHVRATSTPHPFFPRHRADPGL